MSCLEHWLRILASQADVLLFQQDGTWIDQVAALARLSLHLKRHSSDDCSCQQL